MAGPMIPTTNLIFDIVNAPLAPGPEEATFTVLARVDSIYPHAGWCYVDCHQCGKNVDFHHGFFVCKICNAPCRYPMIRYRLHLCVGDHSGGTIFTVFNQVAEGLFDSSANKFFKYLGFDRFPVPMVELVGRFYAFRIRLPDYANKDPDFHNTRVVSLHEINPTPALKSYGFVQSEIAKSKRRSRRLVAPPVKDVGGPSKIVVSVQAAASGSTLAPYAEVSTPKKNCDSRKSMG